MCSHHLDLYVHRAEVEEHKWDDIGEQTCSCRPVRLCAVCDGVEIANHAFVVGQADWIASLASPTGGLLN